MTTLIQSFNSLHSNYLMLLVLGAGVWLTVHGHEQIGSNLILGAFAIIKTSATPAAPVPQIPNEQKQS